MPRQLANRPRAHPPPRTLSRLPHAGEAECPVLPTLSRGYPGAGGRLPTCYSAVRHSIHGPRPVLTVRLACVRRAASVHPEPGSNSPFKCQPVNRLRFDSRVRPVAPIAVSLLGLTDSRGKESRSVHVTHSRQPSSRSACLSGPRLFDRGIRFSRFALVAAVAVCGGARREEVIYAACGGVARRPRFLHIWAGGGAPTRYEGRPRLRIMVTPSTYLYVASTNLATASICPPYRFTARAHHIYV